MDSTALLKQALNLYQQGEVNQAIQIWQSIEREDSPEAYAKAQFNLGVTLREQGDIKGAIETYCNVQREDAPKNYAHAQFNLGNTLREQGDIEGAIKAFQNSKTHYYYEAESYIKILICPKDTHENLKAISNKTTNLLQKLHIKSGNTYEQKVAHYTKATVAKLLIQGDDTNPPSSFRLNSIKNVNDPTEGLVLSEYLQNPSKPQQALINKIFTNDENTNVFISCFTFNHDSLNQFRLYGKEDNKEASGVSLVFKPEFFDHTTEFGFMGQALKLNELDNPKEHSNKSETPNKIQPLQKQALYRCIYIDPKSGYLRLAQRDEITFYKQSQYKKQTPYQIKVGSNRHKKQISQTEKENQEILQKPLNNINKVNERLTKKNQRILTKTIGFILLPLRYLIKHAAFQEEQECRMIYITNLNDKKICEDWHNKNLYINYDVKIKNMVDKIYLSPGAYAYTDFFRRMLPKNQDNKERVRRSDNPFRC